MTQTNKDEPLLACPTGSLFDATAFAMQVVAKLERDGTSYREAAPFVPCSPATLNRVARGNLPDVENYLRITRWLTSSDRPAPATIPALEGEVEPSRGDFRCHNCKRIVEGVTVAPRHCPDCRCSSFSAVAYSERKYAHPPATDAIRAAAFEEAARYHDSKAEKWDKEASRHVRRDGRRSDCQERDRHRADEHRTHAAAIRNLSTARPSPADEPDLTAVYMAGRKSAFDEVAGKAPADDGRVDELEHKLKAVLAHATGGSCHDISLGINEMCCLITVNRNMVYEAGRAVSHALAKPAPQPDTGGEEGK